MFDAIKFILHEEQYALLQNPAETRKEESS
jgi:hypothetical protein